MPSVDFKERLLAGLGGPFPEGGDLNVKTIRVEKKEGYRLEWITYDSEPNDSIPAVVLVPDGVDGNNPAPAICIWHQHNGQWHLGKSEPAGLAGNERHHTGVALAREGYVVLCPDALGFEDRAKGFQLQGGALERLLYLKYVVRGKTMAWKNVLDMRRAVDYISSRADVDSERLGCYGHSMGSTHAYMLGPWEPRLNATVCNCCLPTYAAIEEHEILHCFPNFVTGIYPEADTPDIVSLIAPRALHMNFGELDGGSPIEHVKKAMPVIRRAYESMHAEDNFSFFIEAAVGHVLSDAMWQRTKSFFANHLG